MTQPTNLNAATETIVERRGVPSTPPKRIAHIVSVSGSQAVAVIEHDANSHRDDKYRVEIGHLLKIVTPHSWVIGIVSSVSTPVPEVASMDDEIGVIELTLVGEIVSDLDSGRLGFTRGVATLPTLGDAVQIADKHDLTRVYTQPNIGTIDVGTLYQNKSVPARLIVDDLLSKHFVVVGSTGCGKSTAMMHILRRIVADYQHSRIIVLDMHNEYHSAFGQRAELIDTGNLHLPFWLLNFDELVLALASIDSHHDAECEILREAILAAKQQFSEGHVLRRKLGDNFISVDSPTPFKLSDVVSWIDERLGRLERTHSTTPYRRLKSRIETLTSDMRYSFMFSGFTVEDNLVSVLGRLFRIPSIGKPITVVNLAAVPGEILDIVVSVISRLAFDLAMWSEGRNPMLLVCEEAHCYAPAEPNGKFLPTRQALAKIAKEGRKYGISLALVSQRPSDIDASILSQCGTAIAMRLSTERDQQVVRGTADRGSPQGIDLLPLLADREAIVVGQGVLMPMRIRFSDVTADSVPDSQHVVFSKMWKTETGDVDSLSRIINLWRSGGRTKLGNKIQP